MTIYFLKVIICSALLFACYFLFLEKEKMHRFNRFYLLLSIGLSSAIPLVTFSTTSTIPTIVEPVDLSWYVIPHDPATQPVATSNNNYLNYILVGIYVAVSLFLLFRFIINLAKIFSKAKNNNIIPYFNANLVLTQDKLIPHSFLNYIFIDKKDYEDGLIEQEILQHELTHVREKHTIDILIVELLITFAWFNPFFFLFSKAIRLNHEFLADDGVLKIYNNSQTYQELLINKASQASNPILTSNLNYQITKKRIMMMTKNTSYKIAMLKQISLLPLIACIIFLLGERVIAQDTTQEKKQQRKDKNAKPNSKPGQSTVSKQDASLRKPDIASFWARYSPGSTIEGVSEQLLTEYLAIVDKYKTGKKRWWENFENMHMTDRSRFEEIFLQMSKEQQAKQTVIFVKPTKPLTRVVPTFKQVESWKNAKIYGLWIDDLRVSNSVLNKYSNADFAHYFESKLEKNAINYGKHYIQINLMTNEFYKNYYNKAIAEKKNKMVFKYTPSLETK